MKIFLLFILSSISFSVLASECKGTRMIESESGEFVPYDPSIHTIDEHTPHNYANYSLVNHLQITGQRGQQLTITNVSDEYVGFYFRPKMFSVSTGQPFNYQATTLNGVFSTANSPLNGGGALMPPNTSGTIYMHRGGYNISGYADIYWDSSTCVESFPILATMEKYYSDSKRAGITVVDINQGMAF